MRCFRHERYVMRRVCLWLLIKCKQIRQKGFVLSMHANRSQIHIATCYYADCRAHTTPDPNMSPSHLSRTAGRSRRLPFRAAAGLSIRPPGQTPAAAPARTSRTCAWGTLIAGFVLTQSRRRWFLHRRAAWAPSTAQGRRDTPSSESTRPRPGACLGLTGRKICGQWARWVTPRLRCYCTEPWQKAGEMQWRLKTVTQTPCLASPLRYCAEWKQTTARWALLSILLDQPTFVFL